MVLENLIKYKEKIHAIKYIYIQEDYTDILLDTLKNYQSKDILLRIIKSKASGAITYRLWLIDIYDKPESFTSLFSYNYMHGLPTLADIWKNQSIILEKWKKWWKKRPLGISYEINSVDGCLHITIQAWETYKEDGRLFFTSKETVYKEKLSIEATFEYINYIHPQKNLFDVFEVSFEEIIKKSINNTQ